MSHNSTRLYLLTKPGEKENVSSFTFSGQQQWLSCLQYARCYLQHLQYVSLFQMGGCYLSLMYFSYFLATWSLAHFKPRASTQYLSEQKFTIIVNWAYFIFELNLGLWSFFLHRHLSAKHTEELDFVFSPVSLKGRSRKKEMFYFEKMT